jgi:glycosyltransferase involved in cell wall biosynthesis
MMQVPDSVNLVKLNPMHLKAGRTLASLPALVRYLRRRRPLALLSALNRANLVALWAQRLAGAAVRVVVSEHNTYSSVVQQPMGLRGRQIMNLVRHCYHWADGIVAVSKGVADDLAQVTGIPRPDIRVIYNPVITPELRRKAKAPLAHPWFDPRQPPVVLGVGRLTEQKNYAALIEAFAQVRQLRPARLMILGEGQERGMLEALARQLRLEQNVKLPGIVENPYPYMSQASVFVLSSRWEGLPTVLIEALYCGVPIVATDCPSGPREILAGGKYGQLIPMGNTSALARAIETVLAGHISRPTRESWQPFELEIVVDQYIDTLLGA